MVPGDKTHSKGVLSQEAVRWYCSDPDPLIGWLQRDEVPSPRNLCALLRGTLQIVPSVGKTNCEVIVSILEWCHRVEFFTSQPKMSDDMFSPILTRRSTVCRGFSRRKELSSRSGTNRSCLRLPSSCPKLHGGRASTTRKIGTRWLVILKVVMRSVIGTPHVCCPVEEGQCRERVS